MVETTDGSIENDFTKSIEIEGKEKVIIECKEGICKQISGYIKSKDKEDEDKEIVYAFVGNKVGVSTEGNNLFIGDPEIEDVTNCKDEDLGRVISDDGMTGICYGSGSKDIKYDGGDEHYIILKEKAVPKTPFYDNVYATAVKHDTNYIIKDAFLEGGI